MKKQTDEEIRETLKGWHAHSAQPYKQPAMTDRDRLAEKLFIHAITHENVEGDNRVHKAIYAVEAANILFNQLEANAESKGEKWGDQS